MQIENVEVYGFGAALRGMRNPLESWRKSDTVGTRDAIVSLLQDDAALTLEASWDTSTISAAEMPVIGPDDMRLALSLIRRGGAHRKFLRMIMVWWDVTIPRAIWQELDTYKVATVRNSCSTMHKLGTRDLESTDFEGGEVDPAQLALLNRLGAEYRADKSSARLHKLKMHLPEGFLQRATYSFSYETALHMYYDRNDHRMPEWSGPEGICAWILRLPYMPQFIEAAAKARG